MKAFYLIHKHDVRISPFQKSDKMSRVLFLMFLCSVDRLSLAFCPETCHCDDVNLSVRCIKAGLSNMPNSLNPQLKSIVYKYNDFRAVDVSIK